MGRVGIWIPMYLLSHATSFACPPSLKLLPPSLRNLVKSGLQVITPPNEAPCTTELGKKKLIFFSALLGKENSSDGLARHFISEVNVMGTYDDSDGTRNLWTCHALSKAKQFVIFYSEEWREEPTLCMSYKK